MAGFNEIKKVCEQTSELSEKTIDQFLIYYAEKNDNAGKDFDNELNRYKHVSKKFPQEHNNQLKSQYIAHRIFRENGFIHKYLNHSALKSFSENQYRFLQDQAAQPWRFSFHYIIEEAADDFYYMDDAFTGETFLLYSPGITNIEQGEQQLIMYFNLIGYNGRCWQTQGPIHHYYGFEPDDIFFFATELHPEKEMEADEDLVEDVEANPVPYMMLLAGGNYPLTISQDNQLVFNLAEYDVEQFDPTILEDDFTYEYNKGVYRFTMKDWGAHPHFNTVYYDTKAGILLLQTMTEKGFDNLTQCLIDNGFDIDEEAYIRVNPSMYNTAGEILNKNISLNGYDQLFEASSGTSEEELKGKEKINYFVSLVMPYINAGQEPDIGTIANKAGIDVETARQFVEHIKDRLNNLKGSGS